MAPLLLIAGLAFVALSGLVAVGGLSWFGKLPGDLRFESQRLQVFIASRRAVMHRGRLAPCPAATIRETNRSRGRYLCWNALGRS